MPTPTYTPLANITLGSSAASVTFSSISQAYRDLILVIDGTVSATTYIRLVFNGDTGANYSTVRALGTGSTTVSSSSTYNSIRVISEPTTTQSNAITNIMDYSATDKHKTVLQRGNPSGGDVVMGAGRWANTAAITSIAVSLDSGTYSTGTTMTLFGVAA